LTVGVVSGSTVFSGGRYVSASSGITEFWYYTGITDSDLLMKTSSSGGASGSSGTNGTSGSSGSSGTSGTSGSSGSSGTSGTSGSSGSSGTSGTSGSSGSSGTAGSSGSSGIQVSVSDSASTVNSVTGMTFSGATIVNNGSGNITVNTIGTSGTSGTSGSTGTSGSSGLSGASGTSGTSGSSLTATNRQLASYTLVLADVSRVVEMSAATANNLTIPLNSSVPFPIVTQILVTQYGTGQTSIVAAGGVTIRSTGGKLKLSGQYSVASLVKVDTNEWYLYGDITT
jgi:hypothetical protein